MINFVKFSTIIIETVKAGLKLILCISYHNCIFKGVLACLSGKFGKLDICSQSKKQDKNQASKIMFFKKIIIKIIKLSIDKCYHIRCNKTKNQQIF